MDPALLTKGFAIGFSVAAPVGPIGVLCIRRSASRGFTAGFATGLGVAVADAAYGAVAGFGLTAVSSLLVRGQAWVAPVGGAFLVYLGMRSILGAPGGPGPDEPSKGRMADFASALGLTLANPATVLSFVAVFAALGAAGKEGYGGAARFVAGVLLGSAAWWLVLSAAVGSIRRRITPAVLSRLNRAAGAVLALFGMWIIFGRP